MRMTKVAFCRSLAVGSRGKDVVAHKRALSRAAPDLYPWAGNNFTPYFGPRFEAAVQRYQARIGLRPATGKIGNATHEALERAKAHNKPNEPAFDAMAVALAQAFCTQFVKTPRDLIVDAAFYWYSKRQNIAYSQTRPYQKGKPPWLPSRWDCSSFVTNCYYAANVPDPNGRNYDGLGYTGTLMSNGRQIVKTELKPGDLIFYGYNRYTRPGFPYGSPNHVALFVGDGMVLSMGRYPMGYYKYDYRSDINHFRTYDI
jgi:peptidoglycan hydrolase-like protein with peptidoglycan-binding domain